MKIVRSILLFAVITLLLSNQTYADCLACFELRGVEVEYNTGEKVTGYVQWNEQRHFKIEGDIIFPDVFLEHYDKLYLYTDLYVVNYPHKMLVLLKNSEKEIDLKNVKKLVAKKGEHDGYEGASGIDEKSLNEIELMNKEPVAIFEYDPFGMAVYYYMCYSTDCTKAILEKVAKGELNYYYRIEEDELDKMYKKYQIIRNEVPYD